MKKLIATIMAFATAVAITGCDKTSLPQSDIISIEDEKFSADVIDANYDKEENIAPAYTGDVEYIDGIAYVGEAPRPFDMSTPTMDLGEVEIIDLIDMDDESEPVNPEEPFTEQVLCCPVPPPEPVLPELLPIPVKPQPSPVTCCDGEDECHLEIIAPANYFCCEDKCEFIGPPPYTKAPQNCVNDVGGALGVFDNVLASTYWGGTTLYINNNGQFGEKLAVISIGFDAVGSWLNEDGSVTGLTFSADSELLVEIITDKTGTYVGRHNPDFVKVVKKAEPALKSPTEPPVTTEETTTSTEPKTSEPESEEPEPETEPEPSETIEEPETDEEPDISEELPENPELEEENDAEAIRTDIGNFIIFEYSTGCTDVYFGETEDENLIAILGGEWTVEPGSSQFYESVILKRGNFKIDIADLAGVVSVAFNEEDENGKSTLQYELNDGKTTMDIFYSFQQYLPFLGAGGMTEEFSQRLKVVFVSDFDTWWITVMNESGTYFGQYNREYFTD